MLDNPKIFLSYSRTKSAHEPTTLAVRGVFLEAFQRTGAIAVDPMEKPPHLELAEIHKGIVAALQECDAMFVIEYPPVLNTAYETGLAYGWGVPSYHWLPDEPISRPVKEQPLLGPYLQYLSSSHGAIALASDLTGRLHEKFPSDIADNANARSAFLAKVVSFIEDLSEGPLSRHAIRSRRSYRAFTTKQAQLLRDHARSEPMSWILNSLAQQFSIYISDGQQRFEVDESIYPTFLSTLSQMPDRAKDVRAVADLSSGIERFWEKKNPVRHLVGTRIFRLPWQMFFDEARLKEFLDSLPPNAEEVFVTDADTRQEYLDRLRTGPDNNFVLFGDVIGYYDEDAKGYKKLVLKRSAEDSAHLAEQFERTKAFSVRLTAKSTAQSVKREWLKKREIGEWAYTGATKRSPNYYDNYDKHIRVWVPDYQELVASAANEVISHLGRVNRAVNSGFEGRGVVGEIGVGTGALAAHIARWTDDMELAGGAVRARALGRYVCLDAVDPMVRSAISTLKKFRCFGKFVIRKGSRIDAFLPHSAEQQYDVICGSLILHYLIDHADAAAWTNFFDALHRVLRSDGVAVFAGCHFSPEAAEKQKQLEWWRNEMLDIGLNADSVERFISMNTEMTSMPSVEEFPALSSGKFDCRFIHEGPKHSPFGVAVLTPR